MTFVVWGGEEGRWGAKYNIKSTFISVAGQNELAQA